MTIIKRALREDKELKAASLTIDDDTIEEIAYLADGDARRGLNLLEVCYKMVRETGTKEPLVSHEIVREAYQTKVAVYDKTGEMHYDLISALHKSMRGSDVDASLYWLARMIEGGEDPLYLLRRIVRFASEDVGNANPFALTLTISATEAFKFLGPPEGYLAIAQAVVYLALCEKSNAIYKAYGAASRDVKKLPEYPVPLHIRNAPTKLMGELGYGEGYLYPHDCEDALVEQTYLPDELLSKRYYHPTGRGHEKKLQEFLQKVRRFHGKK
jgi:putative ATPase